MAKKRAVVTGGALCAVSAACGSLPHMAAEHGIRAGWVVLPLILLELAGVAYTLWCFRTFKNTP